MSINQTKAEFEQALKTFKEKIKVIKNCQHRRRQQLEKIHGLDMQKTVCDCKIKK